MRALLYACVAAVAVPMMCAQAISVHDLISTARQQIESADYHVSGQLISVQPGGERTSLPITIKAHWFPGVLRELVEVGKPPKPGPDAAADSHPAIHVLLELRPSGQSSIWIAHPGDKSPVALPFEKWSSGPLGPGFSYEDLLEQQFFWPGQVSEGEEKFGARDCEVVKSTPGPSDKTHYSEVKTWFDPTIEFPVYVEKTLKDSGAVKEFTSFGIRHDEGVWSAHQIEVKIRGQEGSTLLIIDRGSPKANLTSSDFALAQLTHF